MVIVVETEHRDTSSSPGQNIADHITIINKPIILTPAMGK